MDEEVKKPPLGLKPRLLLAEERLREISGVINRYTAVNKTIPQEWIDEYNELIAFINRPKPK